MRLMPMVFASAALALAACSSFDKKGERTLASLETSASPAQLRPALVTVFGRHGLRTNYPGGNPMTFEGPANRAEVFAYKDLGGWEQEIIERSFIDFTPTPTGTRMQARGQIISNPGTMFEDAKFPLLGMRRRYLGMLRQASALAGDGKPDAARTLENVVHDRKSGDYQVPLPLEQR